MLDTTLTPAIIGEFLESLSTEIKRDQVNVDRLPRSRFPRAYDDGMWRTWRREHRVFIEKLALTTGGISAATMRQVTEIAVSCEPTLVGKMLLELFAEIISGSCEEDIETADSFFRCLIGRMAHRHRDHFRRDARASMLAWLPAADPLRIAQDPECGYERD